MTFVLLAVLALALLVILNPPRPEVRVHAPECGARLVPAVTTPEPPRPDPRLSRCPTCGVEWHVTYVLERMQTEFRCECWTRRAEPIVLTDQFLRMLGPDVITGDVTSQIRREFLSQVQRLRVERREPL
jgi:hypothetical protein